MPRLKATFEEQFFFFLIWLLGSGWQFASLPAQRLFGLLRRFQVQKVHILTMDLQASLKFWQVMFKVRKGQSYLIPLRRVSFLHSP